MDKIFLRSRKCTIVSFSACSGAASNFLLLLFFFNGGKEKGKKREKNRDLSKRFFRSLVSISRLLSIGQNRGRNFGILRNFPSLSRWKN